MKVTVLGCQYLKQWTVCLYRANEPAATGRA